LSNYSRHIVKDINSLENLIADIMCTDGPDGHCDGYEIIAKEIDKRMNYK